MKYNRKILAGIFIGIFLISIASALTYKLNNEIEVKIVCINAGYCSSSAICNVSIFAPDDTVLKDGVAATQSPTLAYFNVTLNSSQTSQIGEYNVNGFCKDGSVTREIDFSFFVNRLGDTLDTSEAILYIFLSITVIFLFLLSLFFTFKTPYSHATNEKGEVIKLTRLKYVKLGLIMLDYILMIWVLNTLIGISDSFLTLTIFYGFVSFLFQTLNNLALPFGIFILVLSFFEIIRDTKIQKIINQLGSYRPKNQK